MIRILQSLLALISLLAMAFVAAHANGAPWQEPSPSGQPAPADPAIAAKPHVHSGHHCLVPGTQPGTHLGGQPFAFGYFGARAQTTAIFHRGSTGDWFQWTFQRAD